MSYSADENENFQLNKEEFRIVIDEIVETIEKLKPAPQLNQSYVNSQLVEYLNQPDVIANIRVWQKLTVEPSWFNVLAPFIKTNPDYWLDHRRILTSLGLSDDFINLLSYQNFRPKVDLLNLCDIYLVKPIHYTQEQYRISKLDGTDRKILNLEEGMYDSFKIRVNRYQYGNSGKYFQADHGKNYCGFYYYYEPNSVYYLKTGRTIVQYNKSSLALALGMTESSVRDILLGNEDNIDEHPESSESPEGSNKDIIESFIYNIIEYHEVSYDYKNYALEDNLDQYICLLAQRHKLDTVILTHMTGKTGYVTEVLDLRGRRESIKNLRFPTILDDKYVPEVYIDPKLFYEMDMIKQAVEEQDITIRQTELFHNVIYGKIEADFNPFVLKGAIHQHVSNVWENIIHISGAIYLQTLKDFEYILTKEFVGNVSILIKHKLYDILERVTSIIDYLQYLKLTDCKTYQILYEVPENDDVESDDEPSGVRRPQGPNEQSEVRRATERSEPQGPSKASGPQGPQGSSVMKNILITAYSNGIFYGSSKKLFIPVNVNTLLIDETGINESFYGYPLENIILRTITDDIFKKIFTMFLHLKHIRNDVYNQYSLEKILPKYSYPTLLTFIAVPIEQVELVVSVFPNLEKLEVLASDREIRKSGIKSSVRLIPVYDRYN